jgi:drug/metabolite transporter (DMT)-like permease
VIINFRIKRGQQIGLAHKGRNQGIQAAIASAIFMGIVPIFGKQAILLGFSPLAVVALRTNFAVLMLLLIILPHKRQFLYIYPVGLMGCALAGFTNGLGSILYYSALSRMDASVGHLLYSFYPIFVALWLLTDRQTISKITIYRLILAAPGVYLLVSTGTKTVDLMSAAMMLGAALLYALHLLINQRVLYDAPPPTVTFYTLLSMGLTVLVAFLLFDPRLPVLNLSWGPIIGMALVTFFSRILLFTGVKHLGGLQTSLIGLAELMVTVFLAQIWLGEKLSVLQWTGAVLLAISIVMVGFDKHEPAKRHTTSWLSWLNSPGINPGDLPRNSRP